MKVPENNFQFTILRRPISLTIFWIHLNITVTSRSSHKINDVSIGAGSWQTYAPVHDC